MPIIFKFTGPSAAYDGANHVYIMNAGDEFKRMWSRNADTLPEIIQDKLNILRAAGVGTRIPGFGSNLSVGEVEQFELRGMRIISITDEYFYPRQAAEITTQDGTIKVRI